MAHKGNISLLNSLTNSLPQSFFRDIVFNLNQCHQAAWSHIEPIFSQPVAKDLIPHYRRALFEDRMTEIARKYGLSSRSVKNRVKNASHVEIETMVDSKTIILTALAVKDISFDLTRLRTAQFRKTLAEDAWLFEEFSNSGNGFYGVILHGAGPENKNALDFAYLGFPYADCKGWYGRYDLFLLAGASAESEIIEDTADPKLLKIALQKEE